MLKRERGRESKKKIKSKIEEERYGEKEKGGELWEIGRDRERQSFVRK